MLLIFFLNNESTYLLFELGYQRLPDLSIGVYLRSHPMGQILQNQGFCQLLSQPKKEIDTVKPI